MSEKILVVDDEREIAELLDLSLRAEGFTAIKCACMSEAKAALEREPPALAILDILLPDGDGFELCQYIRQKHSYPIIFLSSRIATIDKVNALGLGADDFVTKPFEPIDSARVVGPGDTHIQIRLLSLVT